MGENYVFDNFSRGLKQVEIGGNDSTPLCFCSKFEEKSKEMSENHDIYKNTPKSKFNECFISLHFLCHLNQTIWKENFFLFPSISII